MQEKRYMNVMVVGGGGREHAIIKKLKENQSIETIYALPGNGGIAADAVCVDIGAKEIEKIAEFAVQKQIDLAVVAPDDPLVMGAVDLLRARGIKTFGPDKKAAIIEGSKAFSKDLMKKFKWSSRIFMHNYGFLGKKAFQCNISIIFVICAKIYTKAFCIILYFFFF